MIEKKAGLALTELVDMGKWQQIQNYFSEVVGAGIRTLDLEGNIITNASGTPRFCSEVVASSPLGLKRCRNCRPLPIPGLESEKVPFSFSCPVGPQNFVIPVIYNDFRVAAHIVIGPVVFGKDEELGRCEDIARDLGINKDELVMAMQEIKTFSFRGIQLAIGLLEEVSSYICQLSCEKLDLGIKTFESSLPEFNEESLPNLNDLLSVLLDVTLNTMKAEMGSIMLLDQKSGELFIKIAKGLKGEVINNVRTKMGEGIAGLVARDKQALLINEETKDPRVKSLLKRPELQSALVAPLKMDGDIIGVLNIGTLEPTNRFTQDNLNLINQLVDRAGEVAVRKE